MSGVLQGAAVLAASGAGAAPLVTPDPRRRALAALGAPVLALAGVAAVAGHRVGDDLRAHAALAGAGVVFALIVLGGLVLVLRRWPAAFALLALGTLPFRVPVTVGGSTASLLVPLYAVIGAGCIAYALRWLGWRGGPVEETPEPRLRRVELALAVVMVLYAVQALYSADLVQAVKNVCFFYVPFALLFRLLLEVRWTRRLLLGCLGLIVALTLIFAFTGFVEAATGRLLITNSKVVEANDLKPYFRVNSLFFDPNIFGRFLALAMTMLAAVLLWTRRPREAWLIAAALAVMWVALVLSLSQSSFAALAVGLAALVAIRWRPGPVIAVGAVAVIAAVAVVLFAPHAINLDTSSRTALNRATSGRVNLIEEGGRMVRDRPLWGFGSGSFATVYRERRHVRSTRVAAVSHTIPLTVTAEQGVLGLAAYLFLLYAAFALLFPGLRAAARNTRNVVHDVARIAVAAAFCALLLHTLVYAAFLEDPLSWTLLAMAGGLRAGSREVARARAAEPVATGVA